MYPMRLMAEDTTIPDSSVEKRVQDAAEEIEDLALKAGKTIKHGVREVGEEVEMLARRMENEVDKTGQHIQNVVDQTFGLFWPLLISIIGVIILWIVVEIIQIMDANIAGLAQIAEFLRRYLWLFFVCMLISSYAAYGKRHYQRSTRWISPFISAAGIVIGLWIVIQIVKLLNFFTLQIIEKIVTTGELILPWLFFLIVVLGYLSLFVVLSKTKMLPQHEIPKTVPKQESPQTSTNQSSQSLRRLYRSGKERILAGICGGIAEYLNIDPVLVRILWIIIIFIPPGLGIFLYVILWFIIPRNQNHTWK